MSIHDNFWRGTKAKTKGNRANDLRGLHAIPGLKKHNIDQFQNEHVMNILCTIYINKGINV